MRVKKANNNDQEPYHVIRPEFFVSGLFLAVAVFMSIWGAANIPEDALVAIQWNTEGVSSAVSKPVGLFLMPGIIVVVNFFAWILPRLSPRRAHLAQSSKAYNLIFLALSAFFALAHSLSILSAAGRSLPSERIILLATALLFMVIGNYVSKVRSNYFVGIRTPWTLSSESSWRKTHRLGGILFVAVGVSSFVVGLFSNVRVLGFVLIGGVLAAAVISIVYSYLAWRKATDRGGDE
jgi:uncharacterized membrane protein